MVINIYTRDLWQAEPPRLESSSGFKATHVFWMNVKRYNCFTKIHCVELLKRAQRYNMSVQNQRDIRYNFMIGGDGNVYEGRGWGYTPLLPKDFGRVNAYSVCIGFMGSFNTAKELPDNMFKVGQDLVAHGVASDYIQDDFKFYDLLQNVPPELRARDDQQESIGDNRMYNEFGGRREYHGNRPYGRREYDDNSNPGSRDYDNRNYRRRDFNNDNRNSGRRDYNNYNPDDGEHNDKFGNREYNGDRSNKGYNFDPSKGRSSASKWIFSD